ncbi:MAG: DNA repair protein RecO [Candidatus Latescibacterota bacterium]|nr:DNA repair protein RecO [Candidatus Latescibacterota bacterium]
MFTPSPSRPGIDLPRSILKTRGIVIRNWRMGDTSRFVTVYTEDLGKLKITARGARKIKSKFGSALELMSEIDAVCYVGKNGNIQTLSECTLLEEPPMVTTDLERFSLANAALELVDKVTVEGEPNGRLYACLRGVLKGLQEVDVGQLEVLFWYFELRVLDALGYRPELRSCTACGMLLQAGSCGFSVAVGGGICRSCGERERQDISFEGLSFLARLQELPTYRRENLPEVPIFRGQIRKLFHGFFVHHGLVVGTLRSLRFFDSLDTSYRDS